MMRAEVGDQLVRRRRAVGSNGELVGVVTAVLGNDSGPPFVIRWYESGQTSKINPDPDRFWIRSRSAVNEAEKVGAGRLA
jgi:hypothetical protein